MKGNKYKFYKFYWDLHFLTTAHKWAVICKNSFRWIGLKIQISYSKATGMMQSNFVLRVIDI